MRDEEPVIHPVDGRGDPTTPAGERESRRRDQEYEKWRKSQLGYRPSPWEDVNGR